MKRKLSNKLTLKKETLSNLTKDAMNVVRGGACFGGSGSGGGAATGGAVPTATCRQFKTQCWCA